MFEGTKGFLVYSTPNHYWPVLGWYVVDLTMVDWNSLMINQPKSKRKIWVWVEIFRPIDKPVHDMLKWLRSSQLWVLYIVNSMQQKNIDWSGCEGRKTDMPLRPTFIFPIELRCDINTLILFSERGLVCTFHFYFSLHFTPTLSTTYTTNKTKLFVELPIRQIKRNCLWNNIWQNVLPTTT